MSHLKETVLRVESLTNCPVADLHLAKFWKTVEGTHTFQGVDLTGSIESRGKGKCGGGGGSLEAEMVTAVNLTTEGLCERLGVLLGTRENQGSKVTAADYGPQQVVSNMLVFNVDSWPAHPSDLLDFGREEIGRLTQWFQPILERAGCKISTIQDQWISLKVKVNGQLWKLDYGSLWEALLTKVPYKTDFADVSHLVELVLVLPISAAQCERAVSAQNRIK